MSTILLFRRRYQGHFLACLRGSSSYGERLVSTDQGAEQLGESECGVVLVEGANALNADREAAGMRPI
jgi:hypothetical protein